MNPPEQTQSDSSGVSNPTIPRQTDHETICRLLQALRVIADRSAGDPARTAQKALNVYMGENAPGEVAMILRAAGGFVNAGDAHTVARQITDHLGLTTPRVSLNAAQLRQVHAVSLGGKAWFE